MRHQQVSTAANGIQLYHAEGAKCIQGGVPDRTLMVAKRKVEMAMVVAAAMAVPIMVVVFLVVFSKYGTEAPLFLFSAPINISSQIWMCFNVQLHSEVISQRRVCAFSSQSSGHHQLSREPICQASGCTTCLPFAAADCFLRVTSGGILCISCFRTRGDYRCLSRPSGGR